MLLKKLEGMVTLVFAVYKLYFKLQFDKKLWIYIYIYTDINVK